MKTMVPLLGRLLPEGQLKNILRRQYFRHSHNPLHALKNVVERIEKTQNGEILLELTNGVKLYGPSDGTFEPSIRYGNPSQLGKIHHYEEFYDFFYVVCEQYVEDTYQTTHTLTKGDVVLDLGAHVGAYTVKAATTVGPEGKVIAIEASEENSKLLRVNVEVNGLRNVIALRKGVWNAKGTLQLRMSTTGGSHTLCADSSVFSGTGGWEEVEVDTVDNILRELQVPTVSFVKMDIEGAEVEALAGMNETLRTRGLKLAIAAYHKRNGIRTSESITRRLTEMGFELHARKHIIHAHRAWPVV
jgi:FkbM family methyltransferase